MSVKNTPKRIALMNMYTAGSTELSLRKRSLELFLCGVGVIAQGSVFPLDSQRLARGTRELVTICRHECFKRDVTIGTEEVISRHCPSSLVVQIQ